jgi:hypothetical protein
MRATTEGSVTPLRRNDVRRRSSSTPLNVGTQAEPLDSRQGAMHDDCPRVVMHMHESTSTLFNSHACMHACMHARTQHARKSRTNNRVMDECRKQSWHTLLDYSSRPGRSTRQRRKWQDTLVCVQSKVSQRCHTCDGSSGPSLPSTACKHSHPQAQPDTYHCACEECVAFGWGARAVCGNARERRGAGARRCAWIRVCQ